MSELPLTFNEVPVRVLYDYEPAEPRWVDDTLGGHPGCPARVTIDHVFAQDTEITALLSEDMLDALEGQVLEVIEQ